MHVRGSRLLFLLAFLAMAGSALAAGVPAQSTAQTTRDDKGVWFITGDNIYDIFDAMGYAVATDRLWQTELYFRSATGRLSEIFGPSQLQTDMFVRTIGYSNKDLKKGFKALSKDSQDAVDGYIHGFNRRVDEVLANPALLPFEYQALSAQTGAQILPQHWTRYDVLAWLAFLQRQFDPEALNTGQLENAGLLQALEANYPADALAMFSDMRWLNDPEALTYIPASTEKARPPEPEAVTMARLAAQAAALPDMRAAAKQTVTTIQTVKDDLQKIGAAVHMGSYAWVVAGSKTADGNPIIYSGPQMGFSVPAITVEGSIKGAGLDISGMTVPGIPFIIIGRTPHHAWSMQVGHAHTLDYFGESPLSVKPNGKTVIHVLGQPDVKLKLYKTIHGPVINPMPYDPKNLTSTVITWDYAQRGFEFGSMDAFFHMAEATSMDQFGQGIDKVAVSQHFCYADKDGNIAYWMSGFDPVRSANTDPRLPVPGDYEHEWPTPIQYRPRSNDRNNPQGYYCGWNNKSNPNYMNAPNNINYSFGPFNRAHVIDDYLKSHNNLTFEDVRDLALNIATTESSFSPEGGVPWSKLGPYFTAAVEAYPNANRLAFLGIVQAWDGHYVAGGPTQWATGQSVADGWVIEDTWVKNMIHLTFDTKLGPSNVDPDVNYLNILIHALEGSSAGVVNQYNWFQDPSGSGLPTDPQQLIVTALDLTMQQLGAPPYNTPRPVITFTHPMLGPLHTAPYSNRSTYAHCLEFGSSGPTRVESMFPLGESGFIGNDGTGHPTFDPNFFSMAPIWDPFMPREFPPPQ